MVRCKSAFEVQSIEGSCIQTESARPKGQIRDSLGMNSLYSWLELASDWQKLKTNLKQQCRERRFESDQTVVASLLISMCWSRSGFCTVTNAVMGETMQVSTSAFEMSIRGQKVMLILLAS